MPETLTINIDDATLPESGGLLEIDVSDFAIDEDDANIITFTDGGDFAGGDASGIELAFMGKDDDEPDEFWFDLAAFNDDFSIEIKSEGPEDTFFFTHVDSFSVAGGIYTINYKGSDDVMQTITLDPGAASVMLLCLARGTSIATPTGEVPIERLGVGDLVLTATNGPAPILFAGRRKVTFPAGDHSQKPVLIPAHAIAPNVPEADLSVSPLHRIFLSGPGVEIATGHPVVAVPAKGLVGWRGIRQKSGQRQIEYFTLLLPRHEAILAEGAPVESLFPGEQALAHLPDADRREIEAAMRDNDVSCDPAAPFLTSQQTQELVADLRDFAVHEQGDPIIHELAPA
ncbi:Hint domain-containing protein [Maritimibacter sp. UBA3975]|uniref:Hint domain-containing protein n=1 Tax=Maritimibacter sp. UBA3975 TaxID=1946833 RepID=UPI000C0B21F8|nr:Hint domain-containing protein [Maritimibacter sp. UBA3975]MAM63324.1 hypothetical protein [Maritimibacter sp.]|tara:strand:+ start:22387 stop:23415 length:1029 start_codon:yes stop_codon:yes gene_type:complete